MHSEEITKLWDSLSKLRKETAVMQSKNYSITAVKSFKKYYNKMHLKLIDYVTFKKDIKLSELAKQLKLSKDIFKHTDKWIGLLSIAIVSLGIVLIYLFSINIGITIMFSATFVSAALVFLLIKKVQEQPEFMADELNEIALICDKIKNYIKSNDSLN